MTALYGFAYTDNALKFLENVTPKKVRGQIRRKIDRLASNPNPPGSKKLQGYTKGDDTVFRIRSGDYRILYVVRQNPDQIIILDIDHRKNIYRGL